MYDDFGYVQARQSSSTGALLRWDGKWDGQAVPYGSLPATGAPARQAGKVARLLATPLAVAACAFRVLYIVVAVPLILMFIIGIVGATITGGW